MQLSKAGEEDESLSLGSVFSQLGIPLSVQRSYSRLGLKSLYAWQRDCLLHSHVLRGAADRHADSDADRDRDGQTGTETRTGIGRDSLVYCAPTSGGKTLVAELVLLKTVLSLRKKAIFVLPFVSLVVEKERHLKRVVAMYNRSLSGTDDGQGEGEGEGEGEMDNDDFGNNENWQQRIKVRGYYGDKGGGNRSLKENIVVCTIEKANTIVNGLIRRGRIGELGVLVLDETHVLGNKMNGYLLELLITKIKQLRYVSNALTVHVQIIALSATMGNVEELAAWMDARLYVTNFRPIPLKEYLKVGSDIINPDGQVERILGSSDQDRDGTCVLCSEGLGKGQQIIVFCPTKFACSATAKHLTNLLINATHYNAQQLLTMDLIRDRRSLVDALLADNPNCDTILVNSCLAGIAYHHSGLNNLQRESVEQAFKRGILSIIVATTTLAAGVNLPAGRVIIQALTVGKDALNVIQYRQMCGRAGRAGQTTYGESFLLAKPFERERALQLSKQALPNIESQMHPNIDGGSAFLKSIVEAIGLNICKNRVELMNFMRSTLLFYQSRLETTLVDLENLMAVALRYLTDARIAEEKSDSSLTLTKLGEAMVLTGFDPDSAVVIFDSLITSQQGLYLESPLHLLYLVTPLDHNLIPDYKKLLSMFDNAQRSSRKGVADMLHLIGVDPIYLSTWTVHPPGKNDLVLCSNTIQLSGISSFFTRHHSTLQPSTQTRTHMLKVLCVTKRLWGAMMLHSLLDGCSIEHVAKEFHCSVFDIENLQRGARISAHKIAIFCGAMGWQAMERIIGDFKTSLDVSIPKELRSLMQIPNMPRKIASVLVENNISLPAQVVSTSAEEIVEMLQLSIGFELQDVASVDATFNVEIVQTQPGDVVSQYMSTKAAAMTKDEMVKDRLLGMVLGLLCATREYLKLPPPVEDDMLSVASDNSQSTVSSFHSSTLDDESDDEFPIMDEPYVLEDTEQPDLHNRLMPLTDQLLENPFYADNQVAHMKPSIHTITVTPLKQNHNSSLPVEKYICDEDLCRLMEELESKGLLEVVSPSSSKGGEEYSFIPYKEIQCVSIAKGPADLQIEEPVRLSICPVSCHDRELQLDHQDMRLSASEGNAHRDEIPDAALCAMMDQWEHQYLPSCDDEGVSTIAAPIEAPDAVLTAVKQSVKRKFSPYLTPFTASKVNAAGRFLHLGLDSLWRHMEKDGKASLAAYEATGGRTSLPDGSTFQLHDLNIGFETCRRFLSLLKAATCFSFELTFRTLPSSFVTNKHNNHCKDKDALSSWTSLCSLSCAREFQVTCSHLDCVVHNFLDTQTPTPREIAQSGMNVLIGIAFNFGANESFYMHLPQLLRLMPVVEPTGNVQPSLNAIPHRCKELIAMFVGFDHLLVKSSHLHILLQRKVDRWSQLTSNPLLLANKSWCAVCRRALMLMWRSGACLEWKLLADVMASPGVVKIASNIKNKMTILRERDVIVRGTVEDPAVGNSILTICGGRKCGVPNLQVPHNLLKTNFEGLPEKEVNLINARVISGFRAALAMNYMAQIEMHLEEVQQLELFQHIEMPLTFSIADLEHSGILIDAKFFSKIRQSLRDRQMVIEYYLKGFCGSQFNVDAPNDVNKLRQHIQSTFYRPSHGPVVQAPQNASDWSTGKQDTEQDDEHTNEMDVSNHPLLKLVKEHRRHTKTIPLITSVLAARRFTRVRAAVNQIGAETGRLIITNPALQQMPHSCDYVRCERPSLHEEITQWIKQARGSSQAVQNLNGRLRRSRAEAEWVKVRNMVCDVSTTLGQCSDEFSAFSVAKLLLVLDAKVADTYWPDIVVSDVELMNKTGTLPHRQRSCSPLWKLWNDHGHTHYNEGSIHQICQVVVEFPSSGMVDDGREQSSIAIVPADQVFRLNAGIVPLAVEMELIKQLGKPQPDIQAIDDQFESMFSRIPLRQGFMASDGFVLIAADYSQIELRIMAHLSEDAELCSAFSKGEDIFLTLAALWKNVPISTVTNSQRNEVKQLCYAIIYGAGATLIAEKLKVSTSAAKSLMEAFLMRFAGIGVFISKARNHCEELGYAETLLGRRRHIPDIRSTSVKQRLRAQRQAVNSICQGSAADLIKLAMVNINCALEQFSDDGAFDFHARRSNPGAALYRALDDARLVLQIHDELVFEVREADVNDVAYIIKDSMEQAVCLNVPLQVKLSVGKHWSDLHPLQLPPKTHDAMSFPSNAHRQSSIYNMETRVVKKLFE